MLKFQTFPDASLDRVFFVWAAAGKRWWAKSHVTKILLLLRSSHASVFEPCSDFSFPSKMSFNKFWAQIIDASSFAAVHFFPSFIGRAKYEFQAAKHERQIWKEISEWEFLSTFATRGLCCDPIPRNCLSPSGNKSNFAASFIQLPPFFFFFY